MDITRSVGYTLNMLEAFRREITRRPAAHESVVYECPHSSSHCDGSHYCSTRILYDQSRLEGVSAGQMNNSRSVLRSASADDIAIVRNFRWGRRPSGLKGPRMSKRQSFDLSIGSLVGGWAHAY